MLLVLAIQHCSACLSLRLPAWGPMGLASHSVCSVIAVSDVHERTISTDLLLGLLKKVQRVRRDLRVVIITTPPTAPTFR